MRTFLCIVVVSLGLLLPLRAPAQKKKPEKKEPPRVLVVAPLGVVPGKPAKATIFGLKLDTVTQFRFQDPKITAPVKILSKNKVNVSTKQDPKRIGDSRVEIELTLPASLPSGSVAFLLETPAGTSAEHRLLIDAEGSIQAEKEPNNGFSQAQTLQVGQTIAGVIAQSQDVDVFRFEGRQGQNIVAEVLAARHGSALDSILTLHDGDGRILASNDDAGGSADSRLELKLPRTGVYFLSLIDAHDQGGPAYVYRLQLREVRP